MTDNATEWMLPEEPPGPASDLPAHGTAKVRKAIAEGKIEPSDTHTGSDPLGRAVGPLEDHTVNKQIRNAEGKLVTPTASGAERKASKRLTADRLRDAQKTAERGESDPVDTTA